MEKQRRRDSLIEDIESELEKDAGSIDPDFIDCRIDELCALEGVDPPKLNDEQLSAAARTVRARAAWRRRNRQTKQARKRLFTRRAVCGAVAACCLVLFGFSANYVSILATDTCLPSKVGVKICCGTQFCRCDMTKVKQTGYRE
jgi:hypothetical protein